MAELILCELGEQGILVLLAHGQAGAVQHLEAVAVQPEHLVHVQDDAPVADDEVLLRPQQLLHLGEGGDGPTLAVVADDADVVVLGHGVLYLPQGEMYLLPCDADFQLRFGPEEHPPQLVGQLEELFFPVGLEQIPIMGPTGNASHTYSGDEVTNTSSRSGSVRRRMRAVSMPLVPSMQMSRKTT